MADDAYEFEGTRIRVFIGNDVWFSGKDVARAMGYANPSTAISSIDKEYKSSLSTLLEDARGEQADRFNKNDMKSVYINGEGMVHLSFISTMPAAKKFKHWVLKEMLPRLYENNMARMHANLLEENARLKKSIEDCKHDADRDVHMMHSYMLKENDALRKTIERLEERLHVNRKRDTEMEISQRLTSTQHEVLYIVTTPALEKQDFFKCGFATRDRLQDLLQLYGDGAYYAALFECRDCRRAKEAIYKITELHQHVASFCDIMMNYKQLERIVQDVCIIFNSLYSGQSSPAAADGQEAPDRTDEPL